MVKRRGSGELERRVVHAAETSLAEQQYVSAIDVFVRLGWLPRARLDEWRQGRVPALEMVVPASLGKISDAMAHLRHWAQHQGLTPSETTYLSRTRHRRPLQFSKSGNPEIERAYRTHWISPALSERKRERLQERLSRAPDLVVIASLKEWECAACGGAGDRGNLLLMQEQGPLCMACADLDALVFLASGDAALTRRAKRESRLSAVVVRYSRSRGHYERQGILVGEAALERAEEQCLADEEARARRREREEARRMAADEELQAPMGREIVCLFPGCPEGRAQAIARHAAVRGSGRVGRTAAGRALDPEAITLAVVASVRHEDTRYDELLMSGVGREEARTLVRDEVEQVLERWRGHARDDDPTST